MKNEDTLISRIVRTVEDNTSLLPRIIVGLIFLSEGIQKFIFPETLGSGRFAKIGFPEPGFWAGVTAMFEIVCGLSVLFGFFVRITSIPLLIIMLTAFITTKWPILVNNGFWSFAHEYRTDFAMTLLLIHLLIFGAGKSSLDRRLRADNNFYHRIRNSLGG
jgi:uncharacterized membrane protein YphA (DoxX/SURF4 family)